MTSPLWFGYTERPEKVRARWEAMQRRAAEYEEQQRILTNITPEAHEEYIANLVHSAYGETLEDDPQRDADLLETEIEKNGWHPSQNRGVKFIVSKSFADRWTHDAEHYKQIFGDDTQVEFV